MKTIVTTLFLILCITTLLSGQWTNFELTNIDSDNFPEKVKPLLQTVSLSSSRHFFSPYQPTNKITVGFSYSKGVDFSGEEYSSDRIGGFPNLMGAIAITPNLSLKGNLSLFKSGNDIVQSFAYGFGLNLTEKENYNWRLSVLFSHLQGPDDLKNRSIDAAIINEFKLGRIPVFAGIGLNTYKTKFLFENINLVPNSIKGNAHHLLLGIQINKGRIGFIPVLQINSDVALLSIEIMANFR